MRALKTQLEFLLCPRPGLLQGLSLAQKHSASLVHFRGQTLCHGEGSDHRQEAVLKDEGLALCVWVQKVSRECDTWER